MSFTPSPQATAATTLLDANLTAAGKPTTSATGANAVSFQCLVDAILPIAPLPLSAWSSLTTYAAGVGVTYANAVWISLAAGNLNKQPDISPAWWTMVLSTAPTFTPQAKAAHFTAAAGMAYEVDTTAASVTCTLPTASGSIVVSVAAGANRVNFAGGTLNGDAAAWIQNVNSSVTLIGLGGTAWRITGVV